MSKGLVIGVGFQKTGTSTLREVLNVLGYKVKDACPRALIPILKGDQKKLKEIIGDHDAVEDTPWYMIYKELDEMYPNSKFILTVRNEQEWYRSVAQHIGQLRSAHHEWIYGRGKGLPMYHKDNTISVYQKHINDVKTYFKDRPNDLVVVDFTKGDKWEKICAFLEKDVPEIAFPHLNDSSKAQPVATSWLRILKFKRKQFTRLAKIKYIDLLRYWH